MGVARARGQTAHLARSGPRKPRSRPQYILEHGQYRRPPDKIEAKRTHDNIVSPPHLISAAAPANDRTSRRRQCPLRVQQARTARKGKQRRYWGGRDFHEGAFTEGPSECIGDEAEDRRLLSPIRIFPRERTMRWGIDLAFTGGFDNHSLSLAGTEQQTRSLAHYAYSCWSPSASAFFVSFDFAPFTRLITFWKLD